MKKNDYGSKNSKRQPANKKPGGWGADRGSKSKTGSGSSGAKRGGRSSFSDYAGRDASFEKREFKQDERVGRPARGPDWNGEGYRKPKKATGRSDFKSYGKTDSQGDRDSKRGGYRDFRESGNDPGGKGRLRDAKRGNMNKGPRPGGNKRAEYRYKKEPAELTKPVNEGISEDNMDREDRIEGRNSVFEAIRSGRPLNKLFVEKDSEDVMTSRIVAMVREKDIPIQYLERSKLDAISQTRTHQGVILEVAAKEYVEVEDILKIAEDKGEKPFVLILDGITDTNNLGSIIRSAECAGVHGIILPKRRSATLNATVAKVAAGALEYVPVARVTNLVQTLRSLKNEGLWIIGADMDGEDNYHSTDLTGPTALVIGSEGEGLARLVKDECDLMVRIPMKGKISSLNAGVAAALVMFEILRQRDKQS